MKVDQLLRTPLFRGEIKTRTHERTHELYVVFPPAHPSPPRHFLRTQVLSAARSVNLGESTCD